MGFATRSALTFGGMKGGQARDILLYNKYASLPCSSTGRGGRPKVRHCCRRHHLRLSGPGRHDHPEINPTGITQYEHVVSIPWDDIEGKDDAEKSSTLCAAGH